LNDEASGNSSRNKSIIMTQESIDDQDHVDKNDEEIFYAYNSYKKEMDRLDTDVLARIL